LEGKISKESPLGEFLINNKKESVGEIIIENRNSYKIKILERKDS
jgi:hypothetical protein